VYESPPWSHESWLGHGKADLELGQPRGPGYGNPGPDQGYALILADRFRDELALRPGESTDDAVAGAVGVALKRASLFGRAPVIHDLAMAFTMWGFLDARAPDDLVALRRGLFEGVSDVRHHDALQQVVDTVPEATLRQSRQQLEAAYPGQWEALLGLTAA
jgi:hypothetical protein